MERLPHGHTHATRRVGDGLVKNRHIMNGRERARVEAARLPVRSIVPVAEVIPCSTQPGLFSDERGSWPVRPGTHRSRPSASGPTTHGQHASGSSAGSGDNHERSVRRRRDSHTRRLRIAMLFDLERNVVTAILDWGVRSPRRPSRGPCVGRVDRPNAPPPDGHRLAPRTLRWRITPTWPRRYGAMLRGCEKLRQLCEANNEESGTTRTSSDLSVTYRREQVRPRRTSIRGTVGRAAA